TRRFIQVMAKASRSTTSSRPDSIASSSDQPADIPVENDGPITSAGLAGVYGRYTNEAGTNRRRPDTRDRPTAQWIGACGSNGTYGKSGSRYWWSANRCCALPDSNGSPWCCESSNWPKSTNEAQYRSMASKATWASERDRSGALAPGLAMS